MVFPAPNDQICRCFPLYRFAMYDTTFMDYGFCFPFTSFFKKTMDKESVEPVVFLVF